MPPSDTLQGWHPTMPNDVGLCKLIQVLYAMPKSEPENIAIYLQHTKEFRSTNNMEYEFWVLQ